MSAARDIGLDVPAPEGDCDDVDCPFHGTLPVRGLVLDGVVATAKMAKTAVVTKEYRRLVPKYERYERRTGRYPAHNPPCIDAQAGDLVTIAECRPLSKSVAYVIVAKRGGEA